MKPPPHFPRFPENPYDLTRFLTAGSFGIPRSRGSYERFFRRWGWEIFLVLAQAGDVAREWRPFAISRASSHSAARYGNTPRAEPGNRVRSIAAFRFQAGA